VQRRCSEAESIGIFECVLTCGKSRDQALPADRLAGYVFLDERHRHVAVLDHALERRNLQEAAKRTEELGLGMRPALQPAEELQHKAVAERDHGVGEVLDEKARSARNRPDACMAGERRPQRVVRRALAAFAQRERISLAIGALVHDLQECDRCTLSTLRAQAPDVLESGDAPPLAGEPARAGQRRDVGQDGLDSLLSLDSHPGVP